MLEIEAELIAGRPARYVQLPTAAGEESAASVARWVALGEAQAARLGVQAVPVMVLERDQADDDAHARQVAGAGLIYLSGGSPGHLADTLRGTRVWAAIHAEWRRGAALAGCSAGAMALTSSVPDIRHPRAAPHPGLGVVPRLRIIPHFDRLRRWMPWLVRTMTSQLTDGERLVGIDEETAIVSDGTDFSHWLVKGKRQAWVLGPDRRQPFQAGETVLL